MLAPLNRSHSEGVNDQPRLEARFDREQAAYLPQHTKASQSLTHERLDDSFEPLPA
jgi:hypothetical protein